mgnify:CR=1 FL=1
MENHHRDGKLDDYFAINGEIHGLIVRAARNALLREAHETLLSRAERARYLALGAERRWSNSVEEHAAILAALEGSRWRSGRAPPLGACATPARRCWRFCPRPRSADRRPDDEYPAAQSQHTRRYHRPHAEGRTERAAAPGTSLTPLTAPRGVALHIDTRGSPDRRRRGAGNARGMPPEFDGAIIAAFGDPGLFAARELFDLPGRRHGRGRDAHGMHGGTTIWPCHVCAGAGPWFEECVRSHGLWERCAGIRMLDGPFREIAEVGLKRRTFWLNSRSVPLEEDEADVRYSGRRAVVGTGRAGRPIEYRCPSSIRSLQL